MMVEAYMYPLMNLAERLKRRNKTNSGSRPENTASATLEWPVKLKIVAALANLFSESCYTTVTSFL